MVARWGAGLPIDVDVKKESPQQDMSDNHVSLPPVLYVPCSAAIQGGELTVDLRPTRDGRVALLVYSALDRLVTCCGANQPWAVIPAADLGKIAERVRFDLILLDIEIPEEYRLAAAR